MSTIICGSWQIVSNKLRTVIFCKKLGWSTFSSIRKTSMGKKIPTSSFNIDLNLDNKPMKIEQSSWKILITDNALFFNSDKQRYCLIAPRNLHKTGIRIFKQWSCEGKQSSIGEKEQSLCKEMLTYNTFSSYLFRNTQKYVLICLVYPLFFIRKIVTHHSARAKDMKNYSCMWEHPVTFTT